MSYSVICLAQQLAHNKHSVNVGCFCYGSMLLRHFLLHIFRFYHIETVKQKKQADSLIPQRLKVPIFRHLGTVVDNRKKISQGDRFDLSCTCILRSRKAVALVLESAMTTDLILHFGGLKHGPFWGFDLRSHILSRGHKVRHSKLDTLSCLGSFLQGAQNSRKSPGLGSHSFRPMDVLLLYPCHDMVSAIPFSHLSDRGFCHLPATVTIFATSAFHPCYYKLIICPWTHSSSEWIYL